MNNEDLKLKPYDRLKAILSENNNGKLSNNAESKLDILLNIEKKENLFDKIKEFFEKIDTFLFKKRNMKNNTIYYKRK